ncbi:M24 family metallopeptidase [Candidatus Dependentiae bacterium]|nr:MAG: M24 family metallopeptidase [Candidatus Dependentiae bacterium]
MFFSRSENDNAKEIMFYVKRRENLIKTVKERFPNVKSGFVVIFGDFEKNFSIPFQQDASFYYLTGVIEPGAVLIIDLKGSSTLYIPCHERPRTNWYYLALSAKEEDALKVGVNEIKELGKPFKGHDSYSYVSYQEYESLLKFFETVKKEQGTIFTLYPSESTNYCLQRFLIDRVNSFLPGFNYMIVDISPIVEAMRRKKDKHEIELMKKAVEITIQAHNKAAQAVVSSRKECEVQADFESIITKSHAQRACPTIVASGQHSTILHYFDNGGDMKKGDLVIVDGGAVFNHYCADITRTYPVSGKFTKRQREVYSLVLELQENIASIARPGYWLNNKEQPDKSLTSLAQLFLKKHNYPMLHGIGHFLGIDIHDVGDYSKPLQEGDVITIEPGIYIPEESLGIRIEDDYLVEKNSLRCLSAALPKKPDEIEKLMLSDGVLASSFILIFLLILVVGKKVVF